MEPSRRFGGKEFQNKIKKAQDYKRVFDPRNRGLIAIWLHKLHLDSKLVTWPILIVLAFGFYYTYISDYFLVNDVLVSGTHDVNAQVVKDAIKITGQERSFFIPKNHLIFLFKSKAEQLVTAQAPLVKEIGKYKRVWPNKVELEVIERKAGFAFAANGKQFLIDEEGVVVSELSDTKGLLIVSDQVAENVIPGETLNNTKLVVFILSAKKQWDNKINTGIGEVKVPGKAALQAQFVSQEGWGVFLDITRPVETQLANLALILNRQIPAKNRLKLAYIDLRFDKWAYYCYKESPCEAQPQNAVTEPQQSEKVEIAN
jgi:cell division septal protein FtsQ